MLLFDLVSINIIQIFFGLNFKILQIFHIIKCTSIINAFKLFKS